MNSSLLFVVVSVLFVHYLQARIVKRNDVPWNGKNWASGCDLVGHDFKKVLVVRDECGGKCEELSECTHYAWTSENGGTCWLKSGHVTKDDFYMSDDPDMICGLKEGPDVSNDPEPSSGDRDNGEASPAVSSDLEPSSGDHDNGKVYPIVVPQLETGGSYK